MMQAILAAQIAVGAFMPLLSEPAPTVTEGRHDRQRMDESPAPAEPARLRCHFYFGCVHH